MWFFRLLVLYNIRAFEVTLAPDDLSLRDLTQEISETETYDLETKVGCLKIGKEGQLKLEALEEENSTFKEKVSNLDYEKNCVNIRLDVTQGQVSN